MDKRFKFSLSLKLKIVRLVDAGKESCNSAAAKLGIEPSSVRRWHRHYKAYGKEGLNIRNQHYPVAFKLAVVRHLLKHGLSIKQTALRFSIPSDSVLWRWVLNYKTYGPSGLTEKKKGRPPKKDESMVKKKVEKKARSSDLTSEKIAELERELAYLRAENAFLKKLEALVQQEKAVGGRDKRQKPSRN